MTPEESYQQACFNIYRRRPAERHLRDLDRVGMVAWLEQMKPYKKRWGDKWEELIQDMNEIRREKKKL